MGHGSGVIVQLAEPEADPVTMTASVILWAVSDRGGNRGQPVEQGPRGANKGPGGCTRARPTRAQGPHKGLAHKGPGGPAHARSPRAQGVQQGRGPQWPRAAHKGPAHKGPAHKGLGGPTRARPTGLAHKGPGRPQGPGPQGPRGSWHCGTATGPGPNSQHTT